MFDFSMLNDEQREAVRDFNHNLLILACAGSGKTRTITAKIAYAISEGIYKPYQILAVTFTNRAANEMRERVAQYLPDEDLSGLEMRTFHSFGAYMLRRNYERAGLPRDFCIYDDADSVSLLSTVAAIEKRELRQAMKEISNLKDRGVMPEDREAARAGDGSYDASFSDRTAIVMGSEGSGISSLVRKNCDHIISIPMHGHIDSLNVSVAAGILMYEFRRNHSVMK